MARTIKIKMDSKKLKSGTEYEIKIKESLVKAKQDDVLEFNNNLNGSVEATITFHKVDPASGTETPANQFCSNIPAIGNAYAVPAGKWECKIGTTGDIKYDVTAANHAILDPVVIIDEYRNLSMEEFSDFRSDFNQFVSDTQENFADVKQSMPEAGGVSLLVLGAVALIALVVGFFIGKR